MDNGKNKPNLEKLNKKLEECQKLKEGYLEGWKRAQADLINYKKQESVRLSEFSDYVKEEFILKILPVLDNIYLAEKKLTKELKKKSWVGGVLKIKEQLLDILEKEGAEQMKCLGKKFDPNFHEAVQVLEKKDAKPGIVIEEIKKGYTFQGRVLRPARVKITK